MTIDKEQSDRDVEKGLTEEGIYRIKNLPPVVYSMCLRKLGMYSSSYLGNDLYFICEVVNILKNEYGEEDIKKYYDSVGKDWEKTKKVLYKLNKKILKVKIIYDHIEDRDFSKKSKKSQEDILKSYFVKYANRIPLLQEELYFLFSFLINHTSLNKGIIPSEAFKILEHKGFRKVDMTQKSRERESETIIHD